MERNYRVLFWSGEGVDAIRFKSKHRLNSKLNKQDGARAIKRLRGERVFEEAEIIEIWLDK